MNGNEEKYQKRVYAKRIKELKLDVVKYEEKQSRLLKGKKKIVMFYQRG